MEDKIIRGRDLALFMERDDMVNPVCCSREATLTISPETIEATKAPQSGWRSFIYGISSFSISSSGLVVYDDAFTLDDFLIAIMEKKTLSFLLRAANGSKLIFSGKVLITNVEVTGSYKDVVTYSVTLLGDGKLSTDKTAYTTVLTDGNGNPLDDGNGNTLGSTEYGGDLPINNSIDC